MERIELELDTQTIERVRRLAQARHCTVEQLLREMIETAIEEDVFLGMFAEEPEVIDQVLAMAMQAREQPPLRGCEKTVASEGGRVPPERRTLSPGAKRSV